MNTKKKARKLVSLFLAMLMSISGFVLFSPAQAVSPGMLVGNHGIVNAVSNDALREGRWTVRKNLQIGDQAYDDRDYIAINSVPGYLLGCDWIHTPMEARSYTLADNIYSFDVTVSTNLYIAWDSRTTPRAWLNSFQATGESVITRNFNDSSTNTLNLYRKTVSAGERVTLGYHGNTSHAMYLVMLDNHTPPGEEITEFPAAGGPISETMAISAPPDIPTISRFLAPYHCGGWYFVRENLNVGSLLYQFESANSRRVVTVMPDEYKGCEYLQTYNPSKLAVTFFVERDTEVFVTLDTRNGNGPSWLQIGAWRDTGKTMTADGGSAGTITYRIFSRLYQAGDCVNLSAMTGSGDNYAIFFKPAGETKGKTNNPVVPIGADPGIPAPEYKFYANDVFNSADNHFPAGYTVISGNAEIVADPIEKDEQTGPVNLAIGSTVTSSGDLSSTYARGYAVDDNIDTYWEASGTNGWIALNFGSAPKRVDTVVVKVRPLWPDRTQTFTVQGSVGGTTYSTLVASANYNFSASTGNSVTINLPEGTTVTHVRLSFTGNTGSAGRGQVAEFQVFASEPGKLLNLALNKAVTTSGDQSSTYRGLLATDGDIDSYWEANTTSGWISVNLGVKKQIDTLVVKVRPLWGARTQTFSVQSSDNGTNYSNLVASQAYVFDPLTGNSVTVPLPPGTETTYIRLSFTTNSGNSNRAQVAELQLFGIEEIPPEPEFVPNDFYAELSGNNGFPAVLEKKFDKLVSSRVIFEFKLRSSKPDQPMSAALTDSSGSEIATIRFDGDGYLTASNGDNSGVTDDGNVTDNSAVTDDDDVAGEIVLPYRPDTWYTVRLVVDLEKGAYDVWVNHQRKCRGLATLSNNAVDALVFSVEEGSSGSLFIDNVYAYDDTEIYILRDSFTGPPAGSRPEENWSYVNPTAVSVENVPFASDRSMKLAATDSRVTAVRDLPGLSGTVTIEAKVKPVNTGFSVMPVITDSDNRVAAAVAFYYNNIYACDGDNWVKVLDGESPWSYYPANSWYKIKFILNTYTNRYDLYIDGVFRMKGLSFAEDVDTLDKASFTVYGGNTAYINYLDVFEGENLARGLYPKSLVLNVKDAPYNAVGNGIANDTVAIQTALDDAAFTGGTVLLEGGTFLSGMLRVKSDTTLFVDTSARLLALGDKMQFPQVTDCSGRINSAQVGKGVIYIAKSSNVRIGGGGVIDGNGFYGYQENDPTGANRRPTIILTALAYDVTIQNVDLVNSAFWTVVPMESTNMTIRNISINSTNAPNRDGIDPSDLINATIENCNILAGDDAFCFKSSAIWGCRNVDIRNMTLQSTIASGIKFGTDSYDALENISFEDITIKNVEHSGIAIESVDGATVDKLSFERVDMSDTANPLFFVIGNRMRQPPSSPGTRVGYMRNISIKDFNYANRKTYPYIQGGTNPEALFLGLDNTHRIQNARLENVYLELPGGYSTVPGIPGGSGSGYPEQNAVGNSNAWAYCLKWCNNFTFINCVNNLKAPDARQEIMYNNSYDQQPVNHDRPIRYVMPTKKITVFAGVDAFAKLPGTVRVVIDYDKVVTVPVTWANAQYNPDTTGEYIFEGTIGSAAGTINPERLTAKCTVRVISSLLEFSSEIQDGRFVSTLENNSESNVSGILIIAIYKKDGKMAYIEQSEFTAIAGFSASARFGIDIADYPGTEYEYKAFCFTEEYIPLTPAISFGIITGTILSDIYADND